MYKHKQIFERTERPWSPNFFKSFKIICVY